MDSGGATTAAGLSNLLQNRLFLQFLSGAGGAISSGQPIGPALNQITQQNISSQNYLKLLQKMLSGEEVPEGGKVMMDSKGTKIDIPKTALKEFGSDLGGIAPDLGGPSTASDTRTQDQTKLRQLEALNPFPSSQPSISAADLAGLTPQDISQALQFKFGQEKLEEEKINSLIDRMYKSALMTKALRPEALDEPFPVNVPGVGKVTQRQWSSLPTDERAYALFVASSKKLGDEEPMTKKEYDLLDPTDKEKFLRAAMKDPDLMEAARGLAKAGATRISLGEQLAKKKAFGELEGQLYFKNPKWIDDVSKHIASDKVQDETYLLRPEQRTAAIERETVKYIESKIVAGDGTIKDVKWAKDGRTLIWTVLWPSGDRETIKYGIRP